MTSERLAQIRRSIDHNPRGADGYVDELTRACATLLSDLDAARGDRDDTLAILARVAEQLGVAADALAEDSSLAVRAAADLRIDHDALRYAAAAIAKQMADIDAERKAARAEVERLRDRMQLVADDIRHEASAKAGAAQGFECWAKALEEVLKPKGGA